MPNYPTKNQYNGPQFADLLVQQYTAQLTVRWQKDLASANRLVNIHAFPFVKRNMEKVLINLCMVFLVQRLYTLGARKVIIAGLGLMGCIPSILSQSTTSQCSEEVNQLVLPFNSNTKTMINNLNTNLPGARITFIDIHNMIQDILANPGSYGKFSSTYLTLKYLKHSFNLVARKSVQMSISLNTLSMFLKFMLYKISKVLGQVQSYCDVIESFKGRVC